MPRIWVVVSVLGATHRVIESTRRKELWHLAFRKYIQWSGAPVENVNILHVSDLHISTNVLPDVERVLSALWRDLGQLREQLGPLHVACFTGDMVASGHRSAEYELALEHFLMPLMEETGLASDRIFIVPGNHDVNRDAVSVAGWQRWQGLAQVDDINHAIDELSERPLALKDVGALIDGVTAPQWVNPLAYVSRLAVGAVKIGIAGLNSVWASGQDGERGKLLLGERQVAQTLEALAEAQFKVALLHHPLDWLVEEDYRASERALAAFDLVLHGHLHDLSEKTLLRQEYRTVYHAAGALFTPGAPYRIGYSWIKLQWPGDLTLHLRQYSESQAKFVPAVSWVDGGSVTRSLSSSARDSGLVVSAIEVVDALDERIPMVPMLRAAFPSLRVTLQMLFVPPDLRRDSELTQGIEPASAAPPPSLEQVIASNDNVAFVGDDKMGKTTLLHFIAQQCPEHGRLPVFVDFTKVSRSSVRAIMDRAAAFLGSRVSSTDVRRCLEAGEAWVLVDNLNPHDERGERVLATLAEEFPGNRWIVTIREGLWQTLGLRRVPNLDKPFEIYYLSRVTQAKLRQYVERFFQHRLLPAFEQPGPAMARISAHLSDAGFPRNPYYIVLLLTLIGAQPDANPLNEAALLRRYMELILEHSSPGDTRVGTYTFDDKESFLAFLAEQLLTRDRILTTAEFERLVARYHEQYRYLLSKSRFDRIFFEKGILWADGGTVAFRDASLWAYYLAKQASKKSELLRQLLMPENVLAHASTLALLAGLKGDQVDVVSAVGTMLADRLETYSGHLHSLETAILAPDFRLSQVDLNRLFESLREVKPHDLDQLTDTYEEWERQHADQMNTDLGVADNVTLAEGPAELFGLFALYGRLLRNTPEMVGEAKEAGLQLFVIAGLVVWAVVLERLEQLLTSDLWPLWFPSLDSDEIRDRLREIVRAGLPLAIQRVMASLLASPKLQPVLGDMWAQRREDDNSDLWRFMLAGLVHDLEVDLRFQALREFFAEAGSRDLVELMVLKLLTAFISPDARQSDKDPLIPIISDAMETSRGLSTYARQAFEAGLQKRSLLDKVRQTTSGSVGSGESA